MTGEAGSTPPDLATESWANKPVVLVVEDDPAIRILLTRILEREGYRAVPVADGEAGFRSVAEQAPDLVLMDVGLPKMDGYEVTRRLRRDPRTSTLPILLLTGRTGHQDVVDGLDAGADDFVRKPFDQGELLARMRSALRLRRALVGMEASHAVVTALANAVEAKDAMTEHHCQRLAQLASRMALRLGLTIAETDAIAYGALLHDVGKIGVPESVITKPYPLDDEEWDLMRRHPEIGERICAPLAAFAAFGPIIRHHHERWDGTGYPDGLRGEGIPVGARIVSLVDSFDAMTHDRTYRAARPVDAALGEIVSQSERQFDPELVPLLVEETLRGPVLAGPGGHGRRAPLPA
ncbi:MAG TPA: HD domain-containing phosphohydrolase [Candidatus Limnocylindrales bacterium]|jgi:putative two-component system response regulator